MQVFASSVVDVQALAGAIVAIGNFDGLHRGHLALFDEVKRRARAAGVPAGVVTFDPHPVRVLAPHLAPPLILRPDEKWAGMAAAGIDVVYVVAFDADVAQKSPRAFIDDLLVGRFRVGGVVVGDGFRFGMGRKGGIEELRAVFGAAAVAVPAVREGELVCSSSKVREFVMQGNVAGARLILGRPYFVEGEVVRGDGRGRTIGVPTANVDSQRELLPKVGVYATRATLPSGRVVDSVTNVGLRPTFQGQGVRVEAHLFDVDEDLYGRRLTVSFIERLRDEQRFADVQALIAQIHADVAAAKAVLA